MLLLLLLTALCCNLATSYTVLEERRVPPTPLRNPPQPMPLRSPPNPIPLRSNSEKMTKQSSNCNNVQTTLTAVGATATFTSLNYPNNYQSSANCSYFFTSPTGTSMTTTCDINILFIDTLYWSLTGDGTKQQYTNGRGTIAGINSVSNRFSMGFTSSIFPVISIFTSYNYKCTVKVVSSTITPTTTPPSATTTVSSGSTTPSTTNTSCTCGVLNPNGVATKIVGGVETLYGEIPWRVALFIYDPLTRYGGICGGTIISPSWIMTAAHCTMDFKPGNRIDVYTDFQSNPITVGGGVKHASDRYVQHPSFNPNTLDNDMTLVHLSTPLQYKNNVSPACLPFSMVSSTFSGTSVLASGIGTTQPVPVNTQNNDAVSDTLLKVILPVLSTQECQQYLGNQVNNNNICTYNPDPPKDTCQGDSGGSIDLQGSNSFYYAIGVVSWGNGCAQRNYPGVYTKVTNYLSWIQTTTSETYCQI